MLPAPCSDFASFLAANERFMLGVGPLSGGMVLDEIAIVTENELYAATARPGVAAPTPAAPTSKAGCAIFPN
jgi:hypothetical protein